MQELTRLWHRCEVSICRWEDGLNRFTWHRGATNLQFVKKKKQYLWIPTIWEKTNHSICENEVCLYCIAGVSKSLMKIPITHIHTPHSGCRVRVQASGPRLGACALWWPHRSNGTSPRTHLRPGQTHQSTHVPAVTATLSSHLGLWSYSGIWVTISTSIKRKVR